MYDHVAEAPSITSGPYRQLSLAVGQSAMMECSASGSPPPVLAWYQGLLLSNSSDRLVVSGARMQLKVTYLSLLVAEVQLLLFWRE